MGLNQEQNEFIDSLYREIAPLLMRIALANIKNVSQAEEIVQDTFRIACTKIDVIIASPNPKGWLMNTLRYVISDFQRAEVRYYRFLFKLANSQQAKDVYYMEIPLETEYEDIAQSADFLLLKRLYLEHMSILEIAKADNITVEACKKRIQRARKRLKKYID